VRITRPAALGAAAAILAAIAVPLLAVPASAQTTPPWEPDPNSVGSLILYSCTDPSTPSTCSVVTGGTNLNHIADYVEASTPDPGNLPGETQAGNKAVLYFAAPTPGVPTAEFQQGQTSLATVFPNSAAPYTGANPLVSLGSTDGDLLAFATGVETQTATGYVNVYSLRLYTTSAQGGGTIGQGLYWDIDILVNPTAGTWTEEYPTEGSTGLTTTTKMNTPVPNPGVQGQSVTLSATVSASDSTQQAGSVQFSYTAGGVTFPLGSPVAVSYATSTATTGTATLSTTALPPSAPNGTSLTATFTPTDPSYNSSTSAALAYTVNPVANKPTISGKHQVGQSETCSDGSLDFGVTATYAWLANGKQIGTGSRITVPGSAYNKSLQCKASVHDGTGPSSSATSNSAKVKLGAALRATRKPTLSGSHKVGKTERVKTGTWSVKGAKFTYQWLLNGKVIRHATKSTFKPTRGDKGKKLSCRVTASVSGYAKGSATTSSVKVSS